MFHKDNLCHIYEDYNIICAYINYLGKIFTYLFFKSLEKYLSYTLRGFACVPSATSIRGSAYDNPKINFTFDGIYVIKIFSLQVYSLFNDSWGSAPTGFRTWYFAWNHSTEVGVWILFWFGERCTPTSLFSHCMYQFNLSSGKNWITRYAFFLRWLTNSLDS